MSPRELACLYCDPPERVVFADGRWQHVTDGTTVRTLPDGRDDHVATPDYGSR